MTPTEQLAAMNRRIAALSTRLATKPKTKTAKMPNKPKAPPLAPVVWPKTNMITAAILSPRILLSIQQLKVVADDLTGHGVRFNLINLNSGELDQAAINKLFRENDLDPSKIRNTTSPTDLRDEYEAALASGVPLLLISATYHSAPRLREAGIPITIVFNDEAHYLVSDQFQDCFDLGTYQYSFTATQRITDNPFGLGMDNEERFGKVVYTKSPKAMVSAGEIVPPAFHIVDTVDGDIIDENSTGYHESLAKCWVEAFLRHDDVVKERSCDPSQLGGKLLITCEGQDALEQVLATAAFTDFKAVNQDIKIFAISSDFGILMGGHHVPNSPKAKERFLKRLQALKPADRAIIVHVDMLAEGLDVPGITGIMPFRNLGLAKFLQTLGRATRLHHDDRTKLYKNELRAGDTKNFVKPFAWVVIPRVLTNGRDAFTRYLNIVDMIRTEYEFLARDLVVIDDGHGIAPPTDLDFINELPDDRIQMSRAVIEAFFHDIEDGEKATLKSGEFWHNELYAALLNEELTNCA